MGGAVSAPLTDSAGTGEVSATRAHGSGVAAAPLEGGPASELGAEQQGQSQLPDGT